jgi:hypothetical protein
VKRREWQLLDRIGLKFQQTQCLYFPLEEYIHINTYMHIPKHKNKKQKTKKRSKSDLAFYKKLFYMSLTLKL